MRTVKPCICVLLSLLLLFGTLICAASAPENAVSGKCGSFVGYTLEPETGALHLYLIGGAKSAYMANYAPGESPFYGNLSIRSIHIDAWVNSIGSEAFSGCANLESVSIPFTVSSVGDHAFSGCDNASFEYIGTEDRWKDIQFGAGNEWKDDPARVHFAITALTRVGVSLQLPQAGSKVKLNASYPVEDSEKYEAVLNGVYYMKDDCHVYLRDGDVLPAQIKCTFEIAFYPKDGYTLTDHTAFYVNGEQVEPVFGIVEISAVLSEASRTETGIDAAENAKESFLQRTVSYVKTTFQSIFSFVRDLFSKIVNL